ncbi:unnamed protein product [Cuscuta epithymum]|uniref:Uncharacterized protein n=1 Tax=Cuscuta epithymum TaxID=186058 RepID=A0AAV0DGS1_9ASTE|nr:unnamed protein product [Cuscuta epithymum]
MERESVSKSLPDPHKLTQTVKQWLGIA